MTPLDALCRAFFYISGVCSTRTLNKPGAVIQRLTAEVRQALQALKSNDIDGKSIRKSEIQEIVYSEEYYQQKEVENLKRNFDKKLK